MESNYPLYWSLCICLYVLAVYLSHFICFVCLSVCPSTYVCLYLMCTERFPFSRPRGTWTMKRIITKMTIRKWIHHPSIDQFIDRCNDSSIAGSIHSFILVGNLYSASLSETNQKCSHHQRDWMMSFVFSSIFQLINWYIHLFIHPSIHQFINWPSIDPPIRRFIHPSINSSIHHLLSNSSSNPYIHPFIQPSIDSFIKNQSIH